MDQTLITNFLGENIVVILLALFILVSIFLGIRIVPQSEKHVVERFGRLHSVLGPGINIVVPFLDKVAHKISILERQLPTAEQDASQQTTYWSKSKQAYFTGSQSLKKPFTASVTSMAQSPQRLQVSYDQKSAHWNWTKSNQIALSSFQKFANLSVQWWMTGASK